MAAQLCGILFAFGWSFGMTLVIAFVVDLCIGLRVSDEEEEEHTSYCDMEGCDRNFPHEHVTGQGGGTLTGAASNDKGADALAKDWYSKI